MTGENFIRLNRHDAHLEKMIEGLNELRAKWSEVYRDTDNDNYFDIISKIENKIETLKNNIYTYVYNRNLNNYNYVKEFAKKYLYW